MELNITAGGNMIFKPVSAGDTVEFTPTQGSMEFIFSNKLLKEHLLDKEGLPNELGIDMYLRVVAAGLYSLAKALEPKKGPGTEQMLDELRKYMQSLSCVQTGAPVVTMETFSSSGS